VVGITCLYTDSLCTINLILISMHIPVFFFQVYSQCGNLCKKPSNLPPQFINTAEYQNLFASLASSDHRDIGAAAAKSIADANSGGVSRSQIIAAGGAPPPYKDLTSSANPRSSFSGNPSFKPLSPTAPRLQSSDGFNISLF